MPKSAEVVRESPYRATRSLSSIGVVDVSVGVACTASEDMCRQEYALQSDLAYQVQRFGVGHHGVSGVVDFDHMDLTTALALVEESNQAWLRLPKVVRDRYASWANVEKAAASGELEQVLKAAGIGGDQPPKPAASASDSAPGDQADV